MKSDPSLLLEELKKCVAPVSDKNIVVLLLTPNGKYSGHNIEIANPLWFFHAEEMALAKMLDNESTPQIKKIIMAGSGSSITLKNVLPCFHCFQKLKLFMDDKTVIEILNPDVTKKSLWLTVEDFQDAYKIQQEESITGYTHEQIVADLKQRTPLINADLEFIADLRIFGLKHGITFLLIGSAAGRGGTSKIIIKKTGRSYGDIDLIAITSKSPDDVENDVLNLIKRHYTSCVLTKKSCPVPSRYTTRLKRKYSCKNKDGSSRLIELDIGSNIKDVLHLPEYVERHWFYSLS